jgi:predicted AAA+ superfamily ATPase
MSIASKGNQTIYVQVCYLLSDERVIEREFGNLEKINDNYPKFVVSLDPVSFGNRQGISHIRAWDFLQDERLM